MTVAHLPKFEPGFDHVIRLPGSKSVTNRALMCAALARGTSKLTNILDAADTQAMVGALSALGVEIAPSSSESELVVLGANGRIANHQIEVDARSSGTTSRFLLALAARATRPFTITGSAQLSARPFGDGIDAVRQLGVVVAGDGLPLDVGPGAAALSEITVRADISSQFLTGALLVAPCLERKTVISVDGVLRSRPYVDLTLSVMRQFGAVVEEESPGRFAIEPTGYRATSILIEPDASAASYFFGLAAVCRGRIGVEGLAHSQQGDARFPDVLAQMGANVWRDGDILGVTCEEYLHGIDVDMGEISDTAQTLAAVAACANSVTTIRGVGFIRRKEVDRIALTAQELRRAGVDIVEDPDGWTIAPSQLNPARFESHDDHRIAMSMAVLGARLGDCTVEHAEAVDKTFPSFFSVWNGLKEQR
jgi:3-phosphoshikimate 1-carboxyvinyltransferase